MMRMEPHIGRNGIKMINWIVDQLFKWDALRHAIFSEVDWYNSITRIMADPEEMKTATAIWCDVDGWRGWTIKEGGNHYFHDIPEKALGDIMDILLEREAA